MNDEIFSARFRREKVAFRVLLVILVFFLVLVRGILFLAPMIHPLAMILEGGAALEVRGADRAPFHHNKGEKETQFDVICPCKFFVS